MTARNPKDGSTGSALRQWLWALLLFSLASGTWAGNLAVVLPEGQLLKLQGKIDFMADTPEIAHEKLLAGEYDSQFSHYDDRAVNFQSGAVWLRVRVVNNTGQPSLILSLDDALFTEAELLYNRADEGQPVEPVIEKKGVLQERTRQVASYNDISFTLDIASGQARTIFLRLHTPYLLLLKPYITDDQSYQAKIFEQIARVFLRAGIMVGVMVYLFMIAYSVRGIPETRYCLSFVVISCLILLYGRGYLFAYLPGANWLKQHLYVMLFAAQAFAYTGFSRLHFDTSKDFHQIDRILLGCQWFAGAVFLSGFILPLTLSVSIVGAMAFVVTILLSVCSAYVWANSDRHLTIYIVGTITFLFVCILATLENMGLFSMDGKTGEAYEAGICVQAILFAVALAERVSTYQKERARYAVSAAEAQAESRAKSSFLAKMSHELRTPMNGLLGMMQLLERTPLNNQQQHYINAMQNSGRMLLGVIDDVLDYSRITAGELRIHESNFNLHEKLSETEAMFSLSAEQKKLQLRFFINPNVPAIIRGDAGRLQQILNNFIGNAIKFTEKGSVTVRIGIEQSADGAWTLHGEVEDTGIGISPEQLNALFKEYAQVDGGKNFGGSGLGLVICKQLVELMHGSIHVESVLGYGSVFQFHIAVKPPLSDGDNNADKNSETTAHILVVEDNAVNSEVITGMLTQLGHYAETLNNGEEAVSAVCREANHWNLVLMDLEMPVMDGLTAAQKIRQWEAANSRDGVPIIALSGHASEAYADVIRKAGMDDYLKKPLDIAQLNNMLVKWLPNRTKTVGEQ